MEKWKWPDMWPSMVTHTRNQCSAFIPSKVHTHSSEHTPGAVGSHLCCDTRGTVGGSVSCSRAPQSWYWRWRERCTITPPTYNSCQTGDSQPLGYESDSLTIKATTSPTKKVKKYLHSRTSRRIQDWRWSWELASAIYSVCWAKPWNRRRVITLITCYQSPA